MTTRRNAILAHSSRKNRPIQQPKEIAAMTAKLNEKNKADECVSLSENAALEEALEESSFQIEYDDEIYNIEFDKVELNFSSFKKRIKRTLALYDDILVYYQIDEDVMLTRLAKVPDADHFEELLEWNASIDLDFDIIKFIVKINEKSISNIDLLEPAQAVLKLVDKSAKVEAAVEKLEVRLYDVVAEEASNEDAPENNNKASDEDALEVIGTIDVDNDANIAPCKIDMIDDLLCEILSKQKDISVQPFDDPSISFRDNVNERNMNALRINVPHDVNVINNLLEHTYILFINMIIILNTYMVEIQCIIICVLINVSNGINVVLLGNKLSFDDSTKTDYGLVKVLLHTFCEMNLRKQLSEIYVECDNNTTSSNKNYAKSIECMCSDGFPEAKREKDQIIQISNVCYIQGSEHRDRDREEIEEKVSKSPDPDLDIYFHKSVFCLNTCSPIAGCNVYCFTTEKELLIEWCKFIRKLDPDILTGYNIVNFDLPYLLNRAKYLSIDRFSYLGREKNSKSIIRESSFSSKAYGSSKSKDINITGRIQMDLLPIIRRNHKLRSYSLNSVSYHFLLSQKEDVEYSIIGTLQTGTADTRRRLAAYCLKDSLLVLKLISKLQTTINLIEMARVTGVPINFLITRGQQIKVLSQLYRHSKTKDLIIPYLPYDERNRNRNNNNNNQNNVGYEGATVIEPKRGYYKQPIVTLDFASLYPSIMIAHNLCYTTLINKKDLNKLSSDEYTKTSSNDYFIRSNVEKGVLPQILQNLLSERKKVKKMMKELILNNKQNSMLYAVYNGRQLALKISANSVYGFTGATVGALP
eukprot:206496_1